MINLYETYPEALHLVQELEADGISSADITFLTLNGKPEELDAIEEIKKTAEVKSKKKRLEVVPVLEKVPEKIDPAPNLQGKFFPRLDLFDIQGLGEVIAAGWLVQPREIQMAEEEAGTISGIIEAIKKIGVEEDIAKTFMEGIRRGATLVGVWPDAAKGSTQRIMQEEHLPLNPHMRGHHYWTKEFKDGDKRDSSELRRLLAVLIPSLK